MDSSHAGQAFPSTRWSRLITDPAADSEAAREAFEGLARRYWRPIAGYVRARWAPTDEDARDATQDFFASMLETRWMERIDPARGSFRGFIKRCLTNFLHDLERKRRTVKRGGAHGALSLDVDMDTPLDLPDPSGATPEDVLDDLWRKEVLGQATDALEAELRERGKDEAFEVFRDFYLGTEELGYGALAARHGITEVDVSNRLAHAKKRFRAHLRSALLETVGSDEDLRAELAWLFEGEIA